MQVRPANRSSQWPVFCVATSASSSFELGHGKAGLETPTPHLLGAAATMPSCHPCKWTYTQRLGRRCELNLRKRWDNNYSSSLERTRSYIAQAQQTVRTSSSVYMQMHCSNIQVGVSNRNLFCCISDFPEGKKKATYIYWFFPMSHFAFNNTKAWPKPLVSSSL